MNYSQAINQQLYTIAYHEPCSRTHKLLAVMELTGRRTRHILSGKGAEKHEEQSHP